MMKSLERLISCMVAELSDHVNMDDATFRDSIRSFDIKAESIINDEHGGAFWAALDAYTNVRRYYLVERGGKAAEFTL